jgi:hypothetical protein
LTKSQRKEPQMPELMIDFITSLDGYGAADGWPGFWGMEGPEYLAWLEDQPEAHYTVLLGGTPIDSCKGWSQTASRVQMSWRACRRSSSRAP